MNNSEFLKLLDKYLEGKTSKEESQLLLNYYNSFQHSQHWDEKELGSSEELGERMLQQLKETMGQSAPVIPMYKHNWFRIAAAAVLIFSLGTTVWWAVSRKGDQPVAVVKNTKPLQQASKNAHAVLMLADGRLVTLDSMADGMIARQGRTTINKKGDELVYEPSGPQTGDSNEPVAFNTISIPRGSKYQVVLPDGSRVWLNAASTLHFPAVFPAKERRVELTGEAYFEVAKDAGKPFRVYASELPGGAQKGALVEVLGTHFNVNAYSDEQILKATLLEGSVKVIPVHVKEIAIQKPRILMPGQQAQITDRSLQSDSIQVLDVDLEEVIAWKNNMFNFNTADIQTIMRQIARWYDVEVEYESAAPVRKFSGKINRNTDLPTVLEILEQGGIRCQLEGKKIIVKS